MEPVQNQNINEMMDVLLKLDAQGLLITQAVAQSLKAYKEATEVKKEAKSDE